jgi:hypothetical protein
MGGSVLGPASFDLTLPFLCGKIQYSPLSAEKLTTKRTEKWRVDGKDLFPTFQPWALIQWTPHRDPRLIEHMRVDHCR